MTDLTLIAGIGTNLKTAADIAKAMMGLRDASLIQGKVIELQSVILAAQSSALAAQSQQMSALDKIRQLEKEVATLKAWGHEKQRYELKSPAPGFLVYMLKPEERGTEPPHWLCQTCYEQGNKSMLQSGGQAGRIRIYKCNHCKTDVQTDWNVSPRYET